MALQVTGPAQGSSLDLSKDNKITWSSVSSDPSSFEIQIVNQQVNPPVTQTIAQNVQTSSGSYDLKSVSNITPGQGYQINLVSTTPNNMGILAQSGQFSVAKGGSTSTSSASFSSSTAPTGSMTTMTSTTSSGSSSASTTDSSSMSAMSSGSSASASGSSASASSSGSSSSSSGSSASSTASASSSSSTGNAANTLSSFAGAGVIGMLLALLA
ncbi:MAG: hypothetical protein Q9227_002094 [Pyrenula ochraceoflavens]